MCLTCSILHSLTHSGEKYDFVGGNVIKSGRFHATCPVTSGLLWHPPSADEHMLSSGTQWSLIHLRSTRTISPLSNDAHLHTPTSTWMSYSANFLRACDAGNSLTGWIDPRLRLNIPFESLPLIDFLHIILSTHNHLLLWRGSPPLNECRAAHQARVGGN